MVFHFFGQLFVIFLSFFHAILQLFAGLGGLFGTFFDIFSCKISVFCEAGRSFLVRKRHFFSYKTSVFAGLGGLFE